MVRHIVAWNFLDEVAGSDRVNAAARIKEELESLVGKIDGLIELRVIIDPLGTSNRAIVLDSLLESEEALAAYQVHPLHKKAAEFITSVVCDRVCLDFS